MADWVRPIRAGWVVRGAVPGPDVDEFADPEQVTAALAARGGGEGTLLAAQHPHRTPEAIARGLDIAAALPEARAAFSRLRATHYRGVTDVVAPYRVDGFDGTALGVLCVVDPSAVGADGVRRVRHTEEVYPDVVAERAAMLSGLGCASSAAMLVPSTAGTELTDFVAELCADLGNPAVSTVDSQGRVHQLWLLGPGYRQKELLAVTGARSLLVADGNHRVAAARLAGEGSLLALVTNGPRLRIGPIHRVLRGTGFGAGELARRWRAVGLDVTASASAEPPEHPGEVVVLAGGEALRVRLSPPELALASGLALAPPSASRSAVPVIDHAVVEGLMIERALGVDPAGPSLRPLAGQQSAPPDVDAVLLLAPVPFSDVLAVHAAGERMPRKATYFTPKPRSGLLLADISH
ncbi:DUF1015 family protein [Amycolatopsis sp. CA-230715]|uniref:DUF1015 family protein n=1 Tax=Amycolatopsis sp. CA-230715 TaxID=2745196 RepID=UPI001C026E30|nr:DUF1015 family protein [Amycolatopsis sp. CA-230715]